MVRFYKLIQCHTNHTNVLKSLLPVNLSMCGCFIVATTFCMIGLELQLVLHGMLLAVLVVSATVFVVFRVVGSEVSTALLEFRDKCTKRGSVEDQLKLSGVMRATFKSLAPIKIYVGSFFVFNRYTPLLLTYKTVDALVTLLCTN